MCMWPSPQYLASCGLSTENVCTRNISRLAGTKLSTFNKKQKCLTIFIGVEERRKLLFSFAYSICVHLFLSLSLSLFLRLITIAKVKSFFAVAFLFFYFYLFKNFVDIFFIHGLVIEFLDTFRSNMFAATCSCHF